jgi:hypothetical protein
MDTFDLLTDAGLTALSGALHSSRLHAPFTPVAIQRYCPPANAAEIGSYLQQLHQECMMPQHMALLAETVMRTRSCSPHHPNEVDLVWTGPETLGVTNRDTGVVVRELFGSAEEEVLVAGFAIYRGREIFKRLAERRSERPSSRVQFFLDVHRDSGDTSLAEDVLHRFARRFRTHEWPRGPLPELFYDPRSIDLEAAKRSSLHAWTREANLRMQLAARR